MSFQFKNSSCVSVGTFNIYIIQPALLVQMGAVPADEQMIVQGDLTQPGIRFCVENCNWTVRPERLSVETTDANVDCGERMASVLESLPWTPVMAVGFNTLFEGEVGIERGFPSEFTLPTAPKGLNVTRRTCHLSIENADEKGGFPLLNLQVTAKENCTELSLNVHADFSGRWKKAQLEASEEIVQHCRAFKEMRTHAIDIATQITGVNVAT